METLDLKQAACFLKLHPEELRRRAKAGRVPAAKVGKCWVFLESDLADYVRSLYASDWQALQVMLGKDYPCHLSNAARSGGLTSSPPTGNEYDDLLEPKRKPSRRNTTTASR